MNAQWFGIAALAALMIAFGVLTGTDDELDPVQAQPEVLGYYVRNAIITETSETGAPRVRFAAADVTQNLSDNSVSLSAVRADYIWPAKEPEKTQAAPQKEHSKQFNHWVLNADRARLNPKSSQNAERIELRGNVEAHSVGDVHNAVLSTQSLDLDTEKQIAHTTDAVQVDVDGHIATGHGLLVDVAENHVQLKDGGTLRVASSNREPATLSLPEVFEWDDLNFKDNVFVLTKVRSKAEPFISANQARATGADLANNQWVLTGAVRLELPNRGLLTADSATVSVRNNRVSHVQLAGQPVNFQHRRSNDQTIYGRATALDYDVPASLLRIPGTAWFRLDTLEWKQDATEYNLATGEARGKHGTGTSLPRDANSEKK
jgi:LPS export ABC transporter protein LptC